MRPPHGSKYPFTMGLRGCQPPVCPACGRPLSPANPAAAENLDIDEPPSLRVDLRTITDRLAGDPEFAAQIEGLLQLSLARSAWGADLREEAHRIATHPLAKAWLQRSDELAEQLGGRKDLLRWRRRGVIRHLHPPLVGLPVAEPLPASRSAAGEETRVFELLDELEYLPIVGIRTSAEGWRPKQPTITHQQARAILGWKAQRLDSRLSRGFVPGYDHASRTRREVRIDVVEFVRWSFVRKRVA